MTESMLDEISRLTDSAIDHDRPDQLRQAARFVPTLVQALRHQNRVRPSRDAWQRVKRAVEAADGTWSTEREVETAAVAFVRELVRSGWAPK